MENKFKIVINNTTELFNLLNSAEDYQIIMYTNLISSLQLGSKNISYDLVDSIISINDINFVIMSNSTICVNDIKRYLSNKGIIFGEVSFQELSNGAKEEKQKEIWIADSLESLNDAIENSVSSESNQVASYYYNLPGILDISYTTSNIHNQQQFTSIPTRGLISDNNNLILLANNGMITFSDTKEITKKNELQISYSKQGEPSLNKTKRKVKSLQ